MKKAFSLIEILVVTAIFAVLGVIATQSILVSLSGARKSEAAINVRENLEYALSVIERNVRNSKSIDCPTSTTLTYLTDDNDSFSFQCSLGSTGQVFWNNPGTEAITSDSIIVTACSFSCTPSSPGVPAGVNITLSGKAAEAAAVDESPVTVSTSINLRVY